MRLFKGRKMVLLFALLAVAAAMIGVLATLFGLQLRESPVFEDTDALRAKVVAQEKELIGFTEYRRFVLESKETLSGHAKLLAASLSRSEGVTEVIERSLIPGLKSSATVAIWYDVEYSFGYDLSPEKYDIRESHSGLEIHIGKPQLLSAPAVTKLKHKVLSGGVFTDEKAAVLKLQEKAAERAAKKGTELAQSPEVMALCEKMLIEALSGFLLKQPGVVFVPQIQVVYNL